MAWINRTAGPGIGVPVLRPGPVDERGLALFVVLVVVVILTVIVFQLCYTVGVEESISQNRRIRMLMESALEAAGKGAIHKIYDDRVDDADEASSQAASALQGAGGLGDLAGGNTSGDATSGGATPPVLPTTIDSRHEQWARKTTEQVNDVNVEVRMKDGESRIDLNRLFEYATLPQTGDDAAGDGAGNDAGTGTGGDGATGDGNSTQGNNDQGGDDAGATTDDASGAGTDEEPVEWTPPTVEQEEATKLMLSRLVEAIIAFNQESQFEYTVTPNPDLVADAIVRYVRDRTANEQTRVIRSIDPLLDLPEVGWEIFHGPPDPAKEEEEDDIRGDAESGDDAEEQVDTEDSAVGILASLAGELGIDLSEYNELEDGVEEIARPLGLRDFFTAFSSGRINLNTARPEMILALLTSFPDFNEAKEVAYQINDYLNSHEAEEEGAESDTGAPGGEQAGSGDVNAAAGEEEEKNFNVFRTLDDLGKVNEEWEESGVPDEEAVLPRLKADLKNVVFGSQYFQACLLAKKNKSELEGEVTLWHDSAKSKIRVISWRILTP